MYNWSAKKEKKSKKVEEAEELQEQVIYMSGTPEGMPSNGVEVDENKIYFYCQVNEKEVLDLNKTIKKLDQEMQFLGIRLNISPPPIELHIHSEGGSAFAGIAAYDAIRGCKTPIHTYIDGCAASAATLLFLAGKKRLLNKNSFMLIHQLSTGFVGKHEEMKDELKNQEKIMHTAKKIYLEAGNMTEEDLVDLLKHDLWLDSATTLSLGFADEII